MCQVISSKHKSSTKKQEVTVFHEQKMGNAALRGYDCDFLEPPPDALLCLICTFVAREPMQMDCCGKLYCKHCLNEHSKLSQQFTCPHCRQDGNGFIDRKSEREVNALKVRCYNCFRKNGCEWTGELASLNEHLDTCDHALVFCPNECEESAAVTEVLRKDLEAHLKDNCPNRSYECPHCKQEGKHHDITTSHLESCPKVAVACPNKDCGEEINRCDITEHLTECPFQVVSCKYIKIGCGEQHIRKEVEGHEKNYESHFHVAMETIVNVKEKLAQFEKTRFKMLKFSNYKASGKPFVSPAFYTRHERYKLSIHVCANGHNPGNDTHISVYAYFLKGIYDDSLIWPFTGSVTVTLLNQLEDKNHHKVAIKYRDGMDSESNRRVLNGRGSRGYGIHHFISHEALAYDPATNCQYLKEDCLCFEVSVQVNSKPWLATTV